MSTTLTRTRVPYIPRATGPFTPTNIPSLRLWYSAQAETSYPNNAQMTTWTDLSGNGNHATAAGTTKPLWQATTGANGGAAVRFQGTGYFTLPNFITGATEGEVLVVVKSDGSDTGFWAFGNNIGSSDESHHPWGGQIYETFGAPSGLRLTMNGTTTAWHRYDVQAKTNAYTVLLNETQIGLFDLGVIVSWTTTPLLGRGMKSGAPDLFYTGYISTICVFNSVLTSTQRADMIAFLTANPSGLPVPPTFTGYPAQVIADSPMSYHRLGETSGTVAADSSGNSRTGTYFAATTGATGLLTGDTNGGTTQDAYINGTGATWMNVTSITVECLIKPGIAQSNRGIVSRLDAAHCFILWMNTSGLITWRPYNGSDAFVDVAWTTAPTINAIYHVVGTYTSGDARLYINGTQVASSTSLTGALAVTGLPQSIEFGSYQNNSWLFTGTIDEVAIYNSVLSPTRIAAHAAAR